MAYNLCHLSVAHPFPLRQRTSRTQPTHTTPSPIHLAPSLSHATRTAIQLTQPQTQPQPHYPCLYFFQFSLERWLKCSTSNTHTHTRTHTLAESWKWELRTCSSRQQSARRNKAARKRQKTPTQSAGRSGERGRERLGGICLAGWVVGFVVALSELICLFAYKLQCAARRPSPVACRFNFLDFQLCFLAFC